MQMSACFPAWPPCCPRAVQYQEPVGPWSPYSEPQPRAPAQLDKIMLIFMGRLLNWLILWLLHATGW
ncbi:hypothetical protein QQF64_012415 [Cirrhinus molitorella]|uniref:Uncharacterized protein n=1 Tax=Cirrhinus molitorella TaxID=172907 RepID=A0ABR3LX60_9TELE